MDYITTTPEIWKLLKPLARANRKDMPVCEKIVWNIIHNSRLGVKFRRQQVISNYIVDFVCLEKKLVIEIDGESHKDQIEYDNIRTEVLNSMGFTVIRFANEEVLSNSNKIETKIIEVINSINQESLDK